MSEDSATILRSVPGRRDESSRVNLGVGTSRVLRDGPITAIATATIAVGFVSGTSGKQLVA